MIPIPLLSPLEFVHEPVAPVYWISAKDSRDSTVNLDGSNQDYSDHAQEGSLEVPHDTEPLKRLLLADQRGWGMVGNQI
jgi:hypothetical protein